MKLKFNVSGMTCTACSARVEKVTAATDGVLKCEVNLLTGSMVVDADRIEVAEAVSNAVRAAGYEAVLADRKTENAKNEVKTVISDSSAKGKRLIASGVFLIVLMYFTMGHMIGLPMPSWYHGTQNAIVAALLQLFLTLPIVYLNSHYYSKGFAALWHRAPNMDSLIAVGSLAALVYGVAALFRMSWAMGHGQLDVVEFYAKNLYFESAATILTLISLGKFLEARAKGKTGDAIRALMDLRPKTATVRRGEVLNEIPVEDVRIGDTVVIRAGGSIPVDGRIIAGRAAIDQSALTGESVPVEKGIGDSVAAATTNQEGYIEISAEKVGEDTTLAQIIRLVEDAGGSKAPIARLADKISGVFVPIVMTIAALTFIGWMLVGAELEFALTSSISVLVISCPCALGLATPVAIMVGTGRGAGMGILFKNAQALENLHRVDTVVLDKTGTLTVGKPVVTEIIPGALAQKQLLDCAAALEMKSEHPFARAILEKAGTGSISAAEDFETIPGKGVAGTINGTRCYGGNDRLMQEKGIDIPDFSGYSEQGKTVLYFASEDHVFLGAIVAADVLKQDSAFAVASMKKESLHIVMLTGDNQNTAQAIAASAGIEQVISDVLPGEKASAVEKLRKEGHCVLMVGDGINDAPALAAADVGVAIGAGTDIAMEAADVVLMSDSLTGISNAVALSKATIRNIRQNLFWAFFYNALGIPIAAGLLYPAFHIQLSPMLGAAAMSFSSVFVVTNALRLRMFRPKYQEENRKLTGNIQECKEENAMETILKVEGMMCAHCKATVEKVCKAVPGTENAVVDLEKKQVKVTGSADAAALSKAITDAGYDVVG